MKVIDEYDETEVVTKDTRPLPYVQCGMRLVHPDDSATWWEVEDIYEDGEATLATLRSCDVRRIRDIPCSAIRARWALYEDFDPNEMER